ncbi:MAG: hypothetical protein ABWK53_02770 [Anaerolineales bacterium]
MNQPGSPHEWLQQAARLLENGQKAQARQVIRQILLQDDQNITAWEYLSQACYTPQEEIDCLERILHLQPEHAEARRRLSLLRPPPPTVPPVANPAAAGDSDLPAPPASTAVQALSPKKPPLSRPRKRRREPLAGLIAFCFFLSCALLGVTALYNAGIFSGGESGRSTASAAADCQRLIEQAMQASADLCERIGPNQVCYGNDTVEAELVPGDNLSFSQRGDVIQVQDLVRLSASPLDLAQQKWGIAIFRVTANLPRSLPGENVTLVVFGNTSLENPAPNLQSFYFSSELGQVVCEQVPFDGILISMPSGAGLRFSVNGAELTLMGSASLRATAGGEMVVSVYEGSASILADGHLVFFGAGQSVSVPLGGENGMEASGPPSEPLPLSESDLAVACTLSGQFCAPQDIQPVNPATAQAALATGLGPTPSQTAGTPTARAATATATPSRTATPTASSTVPSSSSRTPVSSTATSPASTQSPPTQPPPTQPPQGITICHCTDYHSNCQTLYFASGDIGGHANHPNDIIPAPAEGCPP